MHASCHSNFPSVYFLCMLTGVDQRSLITAARRTRHLPGEVESSATNSIEARLLFFFFFCAALSSKDTMQGGRTQLSVQRQKFARAVSQGGKEQKEKRVRASERVGGFETESHAVFLALC